MDILDIDEALKDDSFIFLEDKTHDDVSNILQQWKSNNNFLPLQTQTQQQQQHQQQEHVYKLNSRTFTRPRRKSTQNLESQFLNTSYNNAAQNYQQQQQHQQNGTPILNLEIGGLVTTMHKSFLQDTSPPSSICSSMDVSVERMNNSLITSADFSNINFLQSTQSLDFNELNGAFNLANKATSDGYTLSDMIRDRQALESLTMSGDGTLIKDSEIAQIDEISLMLSKTASGCSTMDNSTESVECNNRTLEQMSQNHTYEGPKLDLTNIPAVGETAMHQTIVLSDEMIGDTTFNLVENSMCQQHDITAASEAVPVLPHNVTHNVQHEEQQSPASSSYKKPAALDDTVCLVAKPNCTFDGQQTINLDERCETPEQIKQNEEAAMQYYESTPHAANVRYNNKQQYTPSIKIAEDVNISPIVAPEKQLRPARILNETFEQQEANTCPYKSQTFAGEARCSLDAMEEMLENMENPNETYNKQNRQERRLTQNLAAGIEMQSVMDLAQAEAELLAGNDEEEFDHMLNAFSKVELNAEQLKMKHSLDTIKRRFNCNLSGDRGDRYDRHLHEAETATAAANTHANAELTGDESNAQKNFNHTMEMRNEDLRKLKESMRDSMRESRELKASMLKDALANSSHSNALDLKNSLSNSKDAAALALSASTLSSSGSSSSTGERLLSRRSRLYDNINLSTFSADCKSPSSVSTSAGSAVSDVTASYIVHKHDESSPEEQQEQTKETELQTLAAQPEIELQQTTEKTEIVELAAPEVTMQSAQECEANMYKLAEKRERDRNRFRTKVVKHHRGEGDESALGTETDLNVPCIDAEEQETSTNDDESAQLQRYSRRDQASAELAEHPNRVNSKLSSKYLTYKKPKDKQLSKHTLPEIMPLEGAEEMVAAAAAPTATASAKVRTAEARSLSRPRFLSGLQKFSAVSKATSAGDLERAALAAASSSRESICTAAVGVGKAKAYNATPSSANFNRTQPSVGATEKSAAELKSPMGIKSKSFHNLSSNFGYNSGSVGTLYAPKALKKPSNGGGVLTEKQAKVNPLRTNGAVLSQPQKADDSVFKVPRLMSGLRAPSAVGGKRTSAVRPSSGYFSLNVHAKAALQVNDADLDTGRHSPTESLSSGSSRSSVQSSNFGLKPISGGSATVLHAATATLTKITTSSAGIPKPSGLKPPSNVKRSGLPRPSSIVRR